ncbi:hypothetical protein GTQ40_11775 [Flavobacteriaceae bacterium R38]|nr:hypothetical protein [Flavobacteriaceae bacterium R38]
MKKNLNKEELLRIEEYLDSKKLVQVDLRGEVLDHIAAGIENNLEKGKPFEAAFILEKQKWSEELRGYSSIWIGLIWNGPKIMMKTCEKHIKKMYFNVLWKSAVGVIFLLLITNIFNMKNHQDVFIRLLDGFYFVVAGILLLSLFQITKTKNESTYRYLYKKNALAMVFSLILFSPSVMPSNYVLKAISSGEMYWYTFFGYFMMVFMGIEFFSLYRKHVNAVKLLRIN